MKPTTITVALLSCLVITGHAVAAAERPHEHGALKLDVVIDGRQLLISMDAPLDNLLGFERAPRSAAERQAAAELLARLRSPNQGRPLFATDAAAQCVLSHVELNSPALAPAQNAASQAAGAHEHADLDASYEFSCAQPQHLRQLELGLFEAYPRIQRIDVQIAGPAGQSKLTLKRPARSVALTR